MAVVMSIECLHLVTMLLSLLTRATLLTSHVVYTSEYTFVSKDKGHWVKFVRNSVLIHFISISSQKLVLLLGLAYRSLANLTAHYLAVVI